MHAAPTRNGSFKLDQRLHAEALTNPNLRCSRAVFNPSSVTRWRLQGETKTAYTRSTTRIHQFDRDNILTSSLWDTVCSFRGPLLIIPAKTAYAPLAGMTIMMCGGQRLPSLSASVSSLSFESHVCPYVCHAIISFKNAHFSRESKNLASLFSKLKRTMSRPTNLEALCSSERPCSWTTRRAQYRDDCSLADTCKCRHGQSVPEMEHGDCASSLESMVSPE